ncbi:hypothetical protein CCP3SC5AM1_950003 [Gammaproteobacteria bacterium]
MQEPGSRWPDRNYVDGQCILSFGALQLPNNFFVPKDYRKPHYITLHFYE